MSTLEARLEELRGLRKSPLDDLLERIESGAALLDRQSPGWFRRIDLARLDMKSCTFCILGQLYGSYGNGQRSLGIHYLGGPAAFGFDGKHGHEFGALAECWRIYMEIRRSAA